MDIDSLTLGEAKKLACLFGGKSEPLKCCKDGYKIVVLQRGWVVVGKLSQEGQDYKLTDAAVLRKWGTTKGITELVTGPTKDTVLDKTPKPITFHELTVVLMLDVEEGPWKKAL